MAHRYVRELEYLPRYFAVGAATFCVDVTIFTYLVETRSIEKIWSTVIIAGSPGFVINFLGHKRFTFEKAWGWLSVLQLPTLFTLKFGNFFFRAYAIQHVVLVWGWSPYVAYMAVGACISLTNFFGARWLFTGSPPWSFRGVSRTLWYLANHPGRMARFVYRLVRRVTAKTKARFSS